MDCPVLKLIEIDNIQINTACIRLPNASLIIAWAGKGFVMCGYLNIETAERFNDAACIVSGVASVEQLLEKPVVKLTKAAEALGVKLGDSGLEALKKMM